MVDEEVYEPPTEREQRGGGQGSLVIGMVIAFTFAAYFSEDRQPKPAPKCMAQFIMPKAECR
jgi:hypothetical protein